MVHVVFRSTRWAKHGIIYRMSLDDFLAQEAAQTESYFRAALAREDQGRLARLRELARDTDTAEAFAAKALFVGWTPGDLRSKDLAEPLLPLLSLLWADAKGEASVSDDALLSAWHQFNTERMRILIHCL